MKLVIVLSVIACGYAAKLDRTYLPPANAGTSGGSPGSLNTPLGPSGFGQPAGFGGNNGFSAPSKYVQPAPGQAVGPNFDSGFGAPAQNFGNQAQDYQRSQPQRAQGSADQSAQILRSDSQNDGESFSYSFETSNGISAEESGVATNGVQAQGAFAYSGDDGQTYRVQYTADENGYQPQGDHLPTSPPIPDEILKSIEENARAAASGTQEGAYNPDEDNEVSQQYSKNAPTSYNQAPTGNQAGPSQLYGAPNAGSRPQNSQAYSQGPQPSQYNAGQNGGSSRPSNAFSQPQSQSPSQLYGSPSNGAGVKPNSFEQQRPSKYSAAPSPNFGSSGPQARPQQYQASPSSQLQSGRLQGSAQVQDASGYQYNQPQGGFGGNNNGAQQNRPQNGAASSLQGFSRTNGNSFPSSSNGQGSFGASPNFQAYGSASTSNSQGSFAPSGPKGPSSFGSNAQTSYGARPNSAGPSSIGQSFGPSSSSFNRPQAGNGFRPQSQAPGAKSPMSSSGYEYNRPSGSSQAGGSQFGGSSQTGGSPQFGGSSQFNGAQSGGGQNAFKSNQGPAQFGAPRAPPSFSEEEGYKY